MRLLTWEKVSRLYEDIHKNILVIIDLILTVPGSSSECERGFRQMKSVKTDTRSCLGEESLADQMTICLHLPSEDELVHCTSKDQCKKCSLKFDMTVEQRILVLSL